MKNLLKKMKNREGFTLAELLIVVAIIAVLVAISIPIFNSQLEKSRDAVTVANLRSAYAEASALMITDPESTTAISGKATKTAKDKVSVADVNIPCTDGIADVSDLPFTITLKTTATKDATVVFEFKTDGTVAATY